MGREKLSDEVLERLGTDIAAGIYSPGHAIPIETDLMTAFSVGRSSVREAIRTLTSLGMVETGPRRGTSVAARSSWNMLNRDVMRWIMAGGRHSSELLAAIDEARMIFEPSAAALVARRAGRLQILAIEAAFARMEEAAAAGDPEAAIQADRAFHVAILRATGNPILEAFDTALDAVLGLLFSVTANHMENYRANLASHHAVLEAIRARDPGAAQQAMLTMIGFTSDRMKEAGLISAKPEQPARL